MYTFLKKLFFIILFTVPFLSHANVLKNGTPIEGDDKEKTSKSGVSTQDKISEKVDYKDVEDVFMKVKRIENILIPKKKLNKKKYTIA